SDNILMVDADSLFGKEYFEKILNKSQDLSWSHPFFHGYNWIVLLPGRDNPVTRVSPHLGIASSGGVWFTTKTFFNKIGNMNENYFGYGREDSDLWIRASSLLYGIPELSYPLTHQYHHWEVMDSSKDPNYQKNCRLWHYTTHKTDEVIKKLINADLGNPKEPTLIDMEE
ncbi:hypothetical protein LCGC14_2028580, partial [marine sediment metagenome]